MTFNYKLINEILEAIFPLPEDFGVIVDCDYPDEPYGFSEIQETVLDIDPDASLEFGMSKLVIISPNFEGVVIKIPFSGFYETEYDSENYYEFTTNWEEFHWAPGTDRTDYCLAEFEKYNKLKRNKLNCFVAKTFYYKTICGVRVFIQEQVTSVTELSRSCPTPSKKSSTLARQWNHEGKFSTIETSWIANCIDKYGQSKVAKFLDYCYNEDRDILADMHDGNFGYRNNNTPVLLDFSNFLD